MLVPLFLHINCVVEHVWYHATKSATCGFSVFGTTTWGKKIQFPKNACCQGDGSRMHNANSKQILELIKDL